MAVNRYGSAVLFVGLLADRPARVDRAAIFYATDTAAVYFWDPTAQTWTLFSGGGVGGYNVIENAGTPLTVRTTIDVRGAGLVASDDAGPAVTAITLGAISTLSGVITEAQHGAKSTGTDHAAMVASGASHKPGFVPDPPASAGSTKFLREDGTWAVPAGAGGSQLGVWTYVLGPSIATPGSFAAWLFGSGAELFLNADGAVVFQACNDAMKAAGVGGSIGVKGVIPFQSKFLWDCPAMSIGATGWMKEKGVPPIAAPDKLVWTSGSILHDAMIQCTARDPSLLNLMVDGNDLCDQALRIGNGGNEANRCILNNVAVANGRVTTLLWESADGEWVEGECRTNPGSGSSPFQYTLHVTGGNVNICNVHHHGIGAGALGGRVIFNEGQANAWTGCHVESGVGGDGQWNIETNKQKMLWTGGKWGYVEAAGELLCSNGGQVVVAGVEVMSQGILLDNSLDMMEVDNGASLTVAGLDMFQNPNTPNVVELVAAGSDGQALNALTGGILNVQGNPVADNATTSGRGVVNGAGFAWTGITTSSLTGVTSTSATVVHTGDTAHLNPGPGGRGDGLFKRALKRAAGTDVVISGASLYAYQAWDLAPLTYAACTLTYPTGAGTNATEVL